MSKSIKYLGISLHKETKHQYSKNYKMLMKETEDDTDEKDIYTMFLDWKNQYYLNDHTIKGNL